MNGQTVVGKIKAFTAKTLIILVGMILLAAIILVAILRDWIVNPPQWQVSVIGQGRTTYQPDVAKISLGVQIDKAVNAEVALNQLNKKVTLTMEAIKKAGVKPEDIINQNYSIVPQYDYLDNVAILAGYNAHQQIIVTVKNLKENPDFISQIIGEATKAGANVVESVIFDVLSPENYKQEARLKAIADAKSKAGSIAQAAGVKLDKVVGWWENVVQAPGISNVQYQYDGKGGMGGGANSGGIVPAGDQEVVIEINLNYKIK